MTIDIEIEGQLRKFITWEELEEIRKIIETNYIHKKNVIVAIRKLEIHFGHKLSIIEEMKKELEL